MSTLLYPELRSVSEIRMELVLQMILIYMWRVGSIVEEGKEELIYLHLGTLKDIGKGKKFGSLLHIPTCDKNSAFPIHVASLNILLKMLVFAEDYIYQLKITFLSLTCSSVAMCLRIG